MEKGTVYNWQEIIEVAEAYGINHFTISVNRGHPCIEGIGVYGDVFKKRIDNQLALKLGKNVYIPWQYFEDFNSPYELT